MQLQHRVPPAPVNDPETCLVDLVVNIVEAALLQHPQRDEAERGHREVCFDTDLLLQPMLHPIYKTDSLNRILRSLTRQPDDDRVSREPVVLVENPRPVIDHILPLVRAERLHLQGHVLLDQGTRTRLKTRLDSNMPLGSLQNSLGNVPDQIRISPGRSRRPMSRISIPYPLLGHDRVEQIDHRVVVRHEALLVLQLVEEDVLTVDPDVRVADLPVYRYLSLNLVFGIIFRYPKIRLAELAVAATSPHNLDKPVSRRSLNVRNILELRPARIMNKLGTIARLYVVVNVTNHMIAFAYDHMVDA